LDRKKLIMDLIRMILEGWKMNGEVKSICKNK